MSLVMVSSMISIFCNAKRRKCIEMLRKCFRISHIIAEFHDDIFMDELNDESVWREVAQCLNSEGDAGE